MKLLYLNLCILLNLLFACQNNVPVTVKQENENDTSNVLKTVIGEGISDRHMPSADPLTYKYKFGDSILLTSTVLPLGMLPSNIGNQKFKILPQSEICALIKRDSNLTRVPNYLLLNRFEKSDTGYYVLLQNLSCLDYGGGGSLSLYLKKDKDSFVVINRSSSSIN
jgi:hypothetical protein